MLPTSRLSIEVCFACHSPAAYFAACMGGGGYIHLAVIVITYSLKLCGKTPSESEDVIHYLRMCTDSLDELRYEIWTTLCYVAYYHASIDHNQLQAYYGL